MNSSIATIITYCTNDFRFISKCIEEAKVFSDQIIVAVCDHFFNGEIENRNLLEHTYAAHPDCQFIEYTYLSDRLYTKYHTLNPDDSDWPAYWAATSRYIGFQYLAPKIETVLFLDSDEIADGKAFSAWFQSGNDHKFDAMRLGSYYYALKPTLQAEHFVNLPLCVKRQRFAPLTLFNWVERIGAYLSHPGPKREFVVGLDGKPFFHHYSWVRTKEECLYKAKTWSHRSEEDWPSLIEEAYSKDKTENLFGTDHKFRYVDIPYFDPFQVEIPRQKAICNYKNVRKINDKDLFRKEIENELI